MAIREDIVASAVSFLQDPSVANAPLDKRIAFLQSKNLTQDEIDASLGRAGEGGNPQQGGNYGYQQQQQQQQQMTRPQAQQQQQQYGYGYGGGGPYQNGPWGQPPPPEVPRRDWRDYFIMATVMSGLSYGVYFIAKRYIVPLIAPPTPPQLEQDKASIDESFARAFALIEQLSTDTTAIKDAEVERKEKLDAALTDVEAAVEDMKTSARRRDDDNRRINEEIRSLQAMIPKAMEAQQKTSDERLRELNTELKSLKTLISNRMSGAGVAGAVVQRPNPVSSGAQGSVGVNGTAARITSDSEVAGAVPVPASGAGPGTGTADAASIAGADRSNTSSPYGRFGSKGGIPAWQLAAAKKNEERKDTSDSGTVAEVDGSAATSPAPTS